MIVKKLHNKLSTCDAKEGKYFKAVKFSNVKPLPNSLHMILKIYTIMSRQKYIQMYTDFTQVCAKILLRRPSFVLN